VETSNCLDKLLVFVLAIMLSGFRDLSYLQKKYLNDGADLYYRRREISLKMTQPDFNSFKPYRGVEGKLNSLF